MKAFVLTTKNEDYHLVLANSFDEALGKISKALPKETIEAMENQTQYISIIQ